MVSEKYPRAETNNRGELMLGGMFILNFPAPSALVPTIDFKITILLNPTGCRVTASLTIPLIAWHRVDKGNDRNSKAMNG